MIYSFKFESLFSKRFSFGDCSCGTPFWIIRVKPEGSGLGWHPSILLHIGGKYTRRGKECKFCVTASKGNHLHAVTSFPALAPFLSPSQGFHIFHPNFSFRSFVRLTSVFHPGLPSPENCLPRISPCTSSSRMSMTLTQSCVILTSARKISF